jgi:hypothetical protein
MNNELNSRAFNAWSLLAEFHFSAEQVRMIVQAVAHLSFEQQVKLAVALYDIGMRAEFLHEEERSLAKRVAYLASKQGSIANDIAAIQSIAKSIEDLRARYKAASEKFHQMANFAEVKLAPEMFPADFGRI